MEEIETKITPVVSLAKSSWHSLGDIYRMLKMPGIRQSDRTGIELAPSTESDDSSHVERCAGRFNGLIWGIWCIECQTDYHARKRLDETPPEYLHRRNGAAILAKVAIREGRHATRREHG